MNRKLLIITGLVFLFVVVALVWYFFYAKPVVAPTLSQTNDPLPKNQLPPRYQFIGGDLGDEQTSTTEVTQKEDDPLIRIWDKPTTGQTFITDQILREETATTTQGTSTVVEVKKMVRATTTVLLFVDRGTGYIYGYAPEDNSVFQITNTVVPGVYDAYIFNDGKRVIMRYANTENEVIVGMIATIPSFTKNGAASSLTNIEYLNSEVSSVAVDELNSKASYVVKTSSGSSVYTVESGGPVPVASSPFGEWDLSYGGQSLYATTKASSFAMGVTTRLPNFNIVIGERPGLNSKPSSSFILTSSWRSGSIETSLVGNNGYQNLSLKTLAFKCGWGAGDFLLCAVPKLLPKGGRDLPDAWFQGLVSFEDDLVYVDTTTLEAFPFFSFENKYGTFDVTSLVISDNNTLISFINKKNGELWILKTKLLTQN